MEQEHYSSNAQLIAVVSYLWFIGWIIAFVLYQNDKSDLAIYHMRQSLGMHITAILGWIIFVIPIIGWLIAILYFVFWLMGLIYAAQGEKKPIPVVGEFFLKLFRNIQ